MKKCKECGYEMAKDARKCLRCGYEFKVRYCRSCGCKLESDREFIARRCLKCERESAEQANIGWVDKIKARLSALKRERSVKNNTKKKNLRDRIYIIIGCLFAAYWAFQLVILTFPNIVNFAKNQYYYAKSQYYYNVSTKMSRHEFIPKCDWIDSEALARYPDDYDGEYITIQGTVTQVVDGTGAVKLTVYCESDYPVAVVVNSKSVNGNILEGDAITIYGVGAGTHTNDKGMTSPLVYAFYYSIE